MIFEKFRRVSGLIAVAAAAILLLIISENRAVSVNAATEIENRMRSVLRSVAGAGEVELLVNEDENGGIVGVCVLTPNADDVAVVFRIQRAVQTALGIENEKIEVIMKEADDR